MQSSPRLEKLQQMLAKTPGDPFLLFAIGMEHKKLAQLPQAIDWFKKTLETDLGYLSAYHQAALTYVDLGDVDSARQTFQQGIAAARKKGDSHAAQEMQDALDLIG